MSYDELHDRQGGASFLLGFIAGSVLGAGLALLYAPRPGSEMRREVADRAQKFGQRAAHEYEVASERVAQFTERGRDAYKTAADKARDLASRAREEAGHVADQARAAAGEAQSAAETGAASARSNLRDVREPRG